MENIYAALLLHRLKKPITEDALTAVVKAAGVSPDQIRIKALVAALSEVNIDEALKAAAFAPVAAPTPAPTAEALKEKPAEAPKEEEKKEEALEGLASLFG